MANRIPRYTPLNPFLIWTDLAMKTTEMMTASAQVISHRTQRMALAGPVPNARDRKEFTLMGQEKVEAAAESAQAMGLRMMRLNQEVGTAMMRQMMAGATGFFSLAGATPSQSTAVHQKMMRDALTHSSRLTDSVARMMHYGLKPIHSRATANARRLNKL